MKKYESPQMTIENEGTHLERKRFRHPAFGVLRVTRRSGHASLFQSALQHQNFIAIEVCLASVDRDLHQDWVHPGRTIVELEMSEAQWAHAVASPGMGEGTPVTFTYRPADDVKLLDIPRIKPDPVVKKFEDEIKAKSKMYVEKLAKAAAALDALANGDKAVSKKELRELTSNLRLNMEGLPGNMAFIQEQFKEAMEHVVQQGKIELESYAIHVAQKTGIETLKAQQPTLIEKQLTKIIKIGGQHGHSVQKEGTSDSTGGAADGGNYDSGPSGSTS